MVEVFPIAHEILGSIKGSAQSLRNMKFRIARREGIHHAQIGHCIDFQDHAEFGHNHGFYPFREQGSEKPTYLAVKRRDGSFEILPYDYLGSAESGLVPGKKLTKRIHFYLKSPGQLKLSFEDRDK